jgi:hypothetical protein
MSSIDSESFDDSANLGRVPEVDRQPVDGLPIQYGQNAFS